jgi:uncharacterized protein YhbP (UPF0306 family)
VIEQSQRRIGSTRIAALARKLLDASTLCAIATVDLRGRPHVNTAYFAWSSELDVVWLSAPDAQHSKNVAANPRAAIAVFDSAQTWGGADRGIQLFGTARMLEGRGAADAEAVYAARFRKYSVRDLSAYRFYRLRPRRLKLFDESELGGGVFVRAAVRRGSVSWERTEVYRSDV